MSKLTDKIKQAIRAVEIQEEFKDLPELKRQQKEAKEQFKEEFHLPTITQAQNKWDHIRVIQVPMKNVKLDELEKYSIDYLRDLHKDIFGTYVPRETGFSKQWIARKIRACFKNQSKGTTKERCKK